MPSLRNPMQERFAQNLASGMSQTKAYIGAGYSEGAATSASSKLARKAAVIHRVHELRMEADHARKLVETVKMVNSVEAETDDGPVNRRWLKQKLQETIDAAIAAADFKEATNAIRLGMQTAGLISDDAGRKTGGGLGGRTADIPGETDLAAFNSIVDRLAGGAGKLLDAASASPAQPHACTELALSGRTDREAGGIPDQISPADQEKLLQQTAIAFE